MILAGVYLTFTTGSKICKTAVILTIRQYLYICINARTAGKMTVKEGYLHKTCTRVIAKSDILHSD